MKRLAKKDWFDDERLPIAVARREPQLPFGMHSHDFSEIVIVTGGRGLHVTGESQLEISAGDAFVISGNRAHDYQQLQQLQLVNILFDPAELPMQLSDLRSLAGYHALFGQEPTWELEDSFTSHLRLEPAELLEAIQLVDQLEAELNSRKSGFEIMANVLLLQLATFLARCYSGTLQDYSAGNRGIAACLAFLDRNFKQTISLDRLAEIAGMSRRNFIRTFEAKMSITPIAYLIRLRIRHASRLLLQTDRSISDIAFEVGFNDSNYFARQFRSLSGVTPRQYRRRYGKTDLLE